MSSRSLDRLLQTKHLFADICGHLVLLSLALAAVLLAEAANRLFGGFGWWGFFLLWFAAAVVFFGIAWLRFTRAVAHCLDWVDARLPTPDLLQRGYKRVDEWVESNRMYFPVPLTVMIVLIVVIGAEMFEAQEIEDAIISAGPFRTYSAVICSLYAIFLVCLLLASFLAGLIPKAPTEE